MDARQRPQLAAHLPLTELLVRLVQRDALEGLRPVSKVMFRAREGAALQERLRPLPARL